MTIGSGRQSRRIEQRRNAEKLPPEPAPARYAAESVSADERRNALLAMIVLGVAFLGACGTYVVLTAGEIL